MCEKDKDPLLEHINTNVPLIYTDVDHISIPEAICVKFINIIVTFTWSYLDVFIMTIGIGLTTHFRLFNDELVRTKNEVSHSITQMHSIFLNVHTYLKHLSQEYWAHRRIQYEELRELVNTVDGMISHLILLSFANNLFFICRQLFFSLRLVFNTNSIF